MCLTTLALQVYDQNNNNAQRTCSVSTARADYARAWQAIQQHARMLCCAQVVHLALVNVVLHCLCSVIAHPVYTGQTHVCLCIPLAHTTTVLVCAAVQQQLSYYNDAYRKHCSVLLTVARQHTIAIHCRAVNTLAMHAPCYELAQCDGQYSGSTSSLYTPLKSCGHIRAVQFISVKRADMYLYLIRKRN
eukprot:8907-Heterococcus_DN1.PRE.1